MNPIINPVTVGFLIAAAAGLAVGALWGRRFFLSFSSGLLWFLPGLLVVYLCGIPIAVLLGIWIWELEGSGAVLYLAELRENLHGVAMLALLGMLTGTPAYLLGYYCGHLWHRREQARTA